MDEAWFETLVGVHLSSVISAAETFLKKGWRVKPMSPLKRKNNNRLLNNHILPRISLWAVELHGNYSSLQMFVNFSSEFVSFCSTNFHKTAKYFQHLIDSCRCGTPFILPTSLGPSISSLLGLELRTGAAPTCVRSSSVHLAASNIKSRCQNGQIPTQSGWCFQPSWKTLVKMGIFPK